MQDSEPQYFDVSAPVVVPAPWWKTWKLAFPAAGAFIIVLAVVFGVNWFTAREEGAAQQESALSRMEQLLVACDDARDPELCKDRVRTEAAQNGAGADACDGLDGDAHASCVSLAAHASGTVDACDGLEGGDRTSCKDLAYFTQAEVATDADICKEIANADLRTSCTMRVIANAVATDDCAAAHVDESRCVTARARRAAIASGDPARCRSLETVSEQTACADGIASVDVDEDGLTVGEEFVAGTSDEVLDTDGDGLADGDEVNIYFSDPKHADTDGDGYNDGTEVEGGHDPLH